MARLAGHAYRAGPGRRPLYPLPANTAQREVFELLRTDPALVVQGPPGTGKTHTIVNLLSALLAEVKRVLVTSAKDQALDVLFGPGMLPAPLQQLCVRVGHRRGNGPAGQGTVERTVTALPDGAATRTLPELRREIAELEVQRAELKRLVARRLTGVVSNACSPTSPNATPSRSSIAPVSMGSRRTPSPQSTSSWSGFAPTRL